MLEDSPRNPCKLPVLVHLRHNTLRHSLLSMHDDSCQKEVFFSEDISKIKKIHFLDKY